LLVLLLLAVVVAVATGCAGDDKESGGGAAAADASTTANNAASDDAGAAADKSPVDIAIVTDLTGPYAGQSGPTPIEAYVKRVNEGGGIDGHKIVTKTYDGQSAAPATLDATRQAIQDKPAAIVFGAFLSDSAMAALGKTDIPVVGFGAFPGWTGHDNVFSIVGDIVNHNSDAWLQILTSRDRKKIALVGVSEAALKLERKLAKDAGVDVVYFNPGLGVQVDAPTALSVAQEIKAKGANGVVVLGVGGPAIQANLNQLGADVLVVEPSEFGPAVAKQYGKKVEGMIFAHPTAQATVDNAGMKQYRDDMTKYGYEENIFLPVAPSMYASTEMLVESLKRVGAPFTAADTVADLNTVRDFTADGMVAKASFPEFHESGTDCLSTSEMKDGEWVATKNGDYPFTCSTSGSIGLAG